MQVATIGILKYEFMCSTTSDHECFRFYLFILYLTNVKILGRRDSYQHDQKPMAAFHEGSEKP